MAQEELAEHLATTFHNVHDDVDVENFTLVFPPPKENYWRVIDALGDPPSSRSKHTAVYYQGSMYIFGGDDKDHMLNDLYAFNFETRTWTLIKPTSPQVPSERYYHSAVVYNGSMYIFGGFGGANPNTPRNHNDLWAFHFDTQRWTQIHPSTAASADYPASRSGHCAVVHQNSMFVFGGFSGSRRLNDLWRFDFDTLRWTLLEPSGVIPTSRCNSTACVADGRVYVFAGHTGVAADNKLYEYDIAANRWRRYECSGEVLAKPMGHTAVLYRGSMFVFGGSSEDKYNNSLFRLDLGSMEWTKVSTGGDLPPGRCYHSCVLLSGSLGGTSGAATVGSAANAATAGSGGDIEHHMVVFGGSSAVPSNKLYEFTFAPIYPPCTLVMDLRKLFREQWLADVTFFVGEKRQPFLAHSTIVRARCPKLFAETMPSPRGSGSPTGTTIEVEVPEHTPQLFSKLLYFLYTGEAGNLDELTALTDVFELLRLSQRYHLPRLVYLCENNVTRRIDAATVVDALKLATASSPELVELKQRCLRFILKSYDEIIMQKNFETLPPAVLVEIMRLHANPAAVAALSPPETPTSAGAAAVAAVGPMASPPTPPIPLRASSASPSAAPPMCMLRHDLARLLEDDSSADFTFIVRGQPIRAHRQVLVARCGFFRGVFRSNFVEAESREMKVVLGDVEPSVAAFNSFLRYVYTGAAEMAVDDAIYLLRASSFFNLTNHRLRYLCARNIERSVSAQNALKVLEAADAVRSEQLKMFALGVIVQNFGQLVDTPDMKHLKKKLLLDIMKALAAKK